jgi:predicted amidohydrolase YtcJ
MKISRLFAPLRKLSEAFAKTGSASVEQRVEEVDAGDTNRVAVALGLAPQPLPVGKEINLADFPLFEAFISKDGQWAVQTVADGLVENEKIGRIAEELKELYEAARTGTLAEKVEFADAIFNIACVYADASNWPAVNHAIAEKSVQSAFAIYKEAARAGRRNGWDVVGELQGQSESGFLKFQLEPVEKKPVYIQPPLRPYKPQ